MLDVERSLAYESARLRYRHRRYEKLSADAHSARKDSSVGSHDVNLLIGECNDALGDVRWSERRVQELGAELRALQGLDDPNLDA